MQGIGASLGQIWEERGSKEGDGAACVGMASL